MTNDVIRKSVSTRWIHNQHWNKRVDQEIGNSNTKRFTQLNKQCRKHGLAAQTKRYKHLRKRRILHQLLGITTEKYLHEKNMMTVWRLGRVRLICVQSYEISWVLCRFMYIVFICFLIRRLLWSLVLIHCLFWSLRCNTLQNLDWYKTGWIICDQFEKF